MRTKALILIFPFAVFLIETASFVPALKEACAIKVAKKNSCSKVKKTDLCETKNVKNSCSMPKVAEQCNSKKAADNNTPDNGCTDNPDCTTCPVCYTFIFQQQFELAARNILFVKNYSLPATAKTSSFIPDVWKPPNSFLYF